MLVGCCLLVAACSNPLAEFGSDDPPATIGSQTVDEAARAEGESRAIGGPGDYSARFDDGACGFEVPPGLSPRCGTVAVPMNWETGQGTVELAVAVFEATGDDPAPDPVIYLEGGPGAHSLDSVPFAVESLIEPLTARSDLILFDQRGAGLSQPRLDCPETTELSRTLEDDPDVPDEQALELFHQALADCRQRLLDDGVDLGGYNSINNAHDVEAIRRSLGYGPWNLLGVSYGTKLGLEVLRQHPESIRSATLDSVYPPQVDSVMENPGTFVDSYQRVVAACNAEAACAAAGDLGQRVAAVVARYQAEPVQIEIRDWIADETDQVYVTGETIVDVIVGALYSPSQFTDIPELITGLEQGRSEEISTFLGQDRTTERFFTTGMFFAIACNEEISFADPEQVAAAVPDDPFGLKDRFDFASNTGNLAFGTCAAFENGQAPASSNSAVQSDVPTLLMAGVYDPVTPVSWAEAAAETLSNATVLVDPNGSHGISTDDCGIGIVLEFLGDPDVAPNSDCLADGELEFVADPDQAGSEIELEAVSYEIEGFGARVETVRPVEWSVGSLSGDQYRRRSFLDPTQFYQLAGDSLVVGLLEEFVEAEQAVSLSSPRPLSEDGPAALDDLASPRAWIHRSAESETAAVDWFETEIDGQVALVVLVSTPAEREQQLRSVVAPALEAITVTGL